MMRRYRRCTVLSTAPSSVDRYSCTSRTAGRRMNQIQVSTIAGIKCSISTAGRNDHTAIAEEPSLSMMQYSLRQVRQARMNRALHSAHCVVARSRSVKKYQHKKQSKRWDAVVLMMGSTRTVGPQPKHSRFTPIWGWNRVSYSVLVLPTRTYLYECRGRDFESAVHGLFLSCRSAGFQMRMSGWGCF